MELNPLNAISPIDGRYRSKVSALGNFFSEHALIRYRVLVEIEYFIALCEVPLEQLKGVPSSIFPKLRDIYENFTNIDSERIKQIEQTTNHDVKAVEYFVKEKFETLGLGSFSEFIHFGLTSQDINNTSIPYSLKEGMSDVYFPELESMQKVLTNLANDFADVAMLAKTHGQPASPTRLGKELYVFVERLRVQVQTLKSIPYSAKFGGATGNFNAHKVAFPDIDWKAFGNHFVNQTLHLDREQCTTQISNYDNLAAHFDNLKRINTILIDLCRDIWSYVSMEYFKQEIKKNEVGSSAMPHKVNPIDFENAEGNLGIANALFEHLSCKLPISRLQRDLTDSTVLRNLGVPIAHTLIAFTSISKGLKKLILNKDAIDKDLNESWNVVAEGIQTILRREGYPEPYETLKELTRKNSIIDETAIRNFINTLNVSEEIKQELKLITPFNYTGI